MKLRYIGPHDEVELREPGTVPTPGGESFFPGEVLHRVAHGGEIEVGQEYGDLLLEQPTNWERAAPAKRGRKDTGDEPGED